jgi:hypothetical protein
MKQIKTFLAVAFLLTAVSVSAQTDKPLRLGVSIIPGVSLNDPAGFVLGADARLQHNIGNSNLSWIVTTGYTHFFETKQNGVVVFPTTSYVPIKAGLKVFPGKNVYLAGELGVGLGIESGVGTSFVYSPSVGVIIAKDWDLSLKYEHFTKYTETQQLALRVAYGFKL